MKLERSSAGLLARLEAGEVTRRCGPSDRNRRPLHRRDLASEATAGRFRSDLFYRLDSASLLMQPLRAPVAPGASRSLCSASRPHRILAAPFDWDMLNLVDHA